MKHWDVVTPEFSKVVPMLDDGSGPTEWGCICVSVEAETKHDALRTGMKHPDMRYWVDMQRGDNANPFTGVKVYDPVCSHGVCQCGLCFQDCPDCIAEAEARHD